MFEVRVHCPATATRASIGLYWTAHQEQIFSLARRLRPDDPFVVQQEALSWRYRDPTTADRMLADAERMAPNNDAIKHSRATLLLDDAKTATGVEQQRLLNLAEAEFNRIAAREPRNSAPIVSLADIQLVRAASSDQPASRLAYIAAARRTLARAFASGSVTGFVLEMAGRIDEAGGDVEGALEDYHRAAIASGPDPHVWTSYARFVLKHSGSEAAAVALNEAVDLNPIDPILNHELARSLARVRPLDEVSIRRAFALAIAEPVRGHLPQLDFAIFLHRAGHYDEAAEQFDALRALPLAAG